jgi:glycosyltransferase involved in cell wall biosynthesis
MRTAIVHYWLLNMRGGERVLEAICRMLPEADVFTLFYDPDRVSDLIRSRRVKASFLQPLRRWHRSLLPLMPLALESLDLRGYDLVVSSESGPAKGVILPSHTRHVCYCHSPMRYLWDLYPDHLHEWTSSRLKRSMMIPLTNYLRIWDSTTANRVDQFAANSECVRRRIWRAYRREAEVIHPPVAVGTFYSRPAEDYYLMVGEMVAYKRLDAAVRLFSRTGRALRVVGQGPDYHRLRSMARPNIEFCGRVSDEELRELYARCRALVIPGEEDFGMTAVEAVASGKPVIALGRCGVLEAAGPYGHFYKEPTEQALEDAILRFEVSSVVSEPDAMRTYAERFSEAEFRRRMAPLLAPPELR